MSIWYCAWSCPEPDLRLTDLAAAKVRLGLVMGWSEHRAYHVIRASACDLRTPMEEVARDVLRAAHPLRALSKSAIKRTEEQPCK